MLQFVVQVVKASPLLDNPVRSAYTRRYTAVMCESNDVKDMDEREDLREKREKGLR